MPLQDTDPHRRNLTVTSLLFILFYWGGGKVDTDNSIKLSMISVTLNNPTVVCVMAWVVLFFFAWRYWLKHKDKIKQLRVDAEQAFILNPVETKKTIERFKELQLDVNNNPPKQHIQSWGGLLGDVMIIRGSSNYSRDNDIKIYRVQERNTNARTVLSSRDAIAFKVRCLFKAALSREGFSDWVLPVCMFVIAAVSGVVSCAMKLICQA